MSYARKCYPIKCYPIKGCPILSPVLKSDISDVYVVATFFGMECIGCLLKNLTSFTCETKAEMLAHLYDHKAAGHDVPKSTIIRLCREIIRESKGDIDDG